MDKFYLLLVGALSVWRVTHLLQAEDGPWEIVVRVRRYAGTGFWGALLDCFYCLSLWIAVPFAWLFGHALGERVLLWLSLSAAAILLERATGDRPASAPPEFFEDPVVDQEF